jgi:hypothetical protein
MSRPLVELFTHPVCSGCREAAVALGDLAAGGAIELATWSTATPAGRARAEALGVTGVPTVVLAGERRALDRRADLQRLIDDIRGAALGPTGPPPGPDPAPGPRPAPGRP